MGKNSEEFIQQREDFYSNLDENEEYATISINMELFQFIKDNSFNDEITVHSVKRNNPLLKEDKVLKVLYKDKRELNKKIFKREQEINHG